MLFAAPRFRRDYAMGNSISLGRTLAAKAIAALFFCPPVCWAWTGKVTGVADGDTITVLPNGRPEKVRL
jgi:endonuclease YncB( thermonuclease family)